METIEKTKTTTPTIIEIEPIIMERRLNRMIDLVRGGHWRRDITSMSDKHCAIGLVMRVTSEISS